MEKLNERNVSTTKFQGRHLTTRFRFTVKVLTMLAQGIRLGDSRASFLLYWTWRLCT